MEDSDERLIIRKEQMEAFEPQAEAAFVDRVVMHLREEHAEAVGRLPDDVLQEMINNGLARGRKYGLSWESSLTAFVALMFEIAPNFDEHPRIQQVLRDESVPPDSRIDMLLERISDQDWEEAERRYDANAWFPDLQEDDE